MLVAASFPRAPRMKISLGNTLLLFANAVFNCSKIVYCSIGFTTNTSAGKTPANSAVGPSCLSNFTSVANVLGFFAMAGAPPGSRDSSEDSLDWRAVMRVLTTQIGLVMRTVAEPARAPASMDSRVVRDLEARPARTAARSKKARVHSYPVGEERLLTGCWAWNGKREEQWV